MLDEHDLTRLDLESKGRQIYLLLLGIELCELWNQTFLFIVLIEYRAESMDPFDLITHTHTHTHTEQRES